MGRYRPSTARAVRRPCAGEEPKEKKPKEESRPWFDRAPGAASKTEILFFSLLHAGAAREPSISVSSVFSEKLTLHVAIAYLAVQRVSERRERRLCTTTVLHEALAVL